MPCLPFSPCRAHCRSAAQFWPLRTTSITEADWELRPMLKTKNHTVERRSFVIDIHNHLAECKQTLTSERVESYLTEMNEPAYGQSSPDGGHERLQERSPPLISVSRRL